MCSVCGVCFIVCHVVHIFHPLQHMDVESAAGSQTTCQLAHRTAVCGTEFAAPAAFTCTECQLCCPTQRCVRGVLTINMNTCMSLHRLHLLLILPTISCCRAAIRTKRSVFALAFICVLISRCHPTGAAGQTARQTAASGHVML